jgi:hypothetical protein
VTETGRSRAQDLEEERDFLLGSLRDLEREHAAGDIDDTHYRHLHDDYTARAATVLREIERLEDGSAPATGRVRRSAPGGRAARKPGRQPRARDDAPRKPSRIAPGVYVAAVLAAVVVGAGIGVVAFSESRPSGSGGPTTTSPAAARLEEAHRLETEDKAVDALRAYDDVIREDPDNVEALSYQGWLLARASQGELQSPDPTAQQSLLDRALASIDRAIAIDPRYPDARFFRGTILYRYRNQPAEAIPEFEAFLANNPPPNFVAPVRNLLNEARQAAAGTPPPSGG